MRMKKRQQFSWSDLPIELLELVALKLSILDVARFKSVCSSWNKAAKGNTKGPFLMFPSSGGTNEQNLNFLSVEDEMKVVYTAKNNLEKLLDGGRCIGSSHGWLVVLDKLAIPWLLNPFSGKEIELPRRESFPEPHKAVISCNPSYDKNYKVAIINHYHRSRLVFCSHGDHEWTVLCNSGKYQSKYQDVVWHDNMLYALAQGEGVVVWDFCGSVPRKRMILSPSCLQKMDFWTEFQYYLAISMGDILVIQRYIKDTVNEHGELIDQADEVSNLPFWPYKTLKFKVFKLDLIQQTLSEVKSLPDQALFVGGNQTICLCTKDFVGLKGDSIYFTDNNWFRMDLYIFYGGYDIGIFNLERDSVDMCDSESTIEPIPHWVSTL